MSGELAGAAPGPEEEQDEKMIGDTKRVATDRILKYRIFITMLKKQQLGLCVNFFMLK